jgi:hypothetical protein
VMITHMSIRMAANVAGVMAHNSSCMHALLRVQEGLLSVLQGTTQVVSTQF